MNDNDLNRKIKVCHLISKHKMDDMRVFHKECKSLVDNGFDVTLIGFGEKAEKKIIDGVKCITQFCPIKNNIELLRKRNKMSYLKALEVDADIYHLHEPELLSIGLKLKRKGKIVVFDSHEFYGWQLHDNIHKIKVIKVPASFMKLIGNLYMQYEKYVCKKIDGVIQVCTLNGKNYFENRCRKSLFIRNLPGIGDYTRKTEIKFSKNPVVAMIGGITEERGVTNLMKASFKAGAKLQLAGNFMPKSYEQKLKEMPEYQCVDYKGFLDKNGMLNVLENSSIGAATLLHVGQYHQIDTFPTKVYDYMAMELPVIISNTPYALKMNEIYHFGICVDPSNIDEIADAITWLKNHPEEAAEMGKNGRKAVVDEFNWEKESKKLVTFYHQLLKN